MVPFSKYHALGNDYIVIDPLKTSVDLTEEAVRLLCDRHFGIGSDGILYGPFYEEDTPVVRIYNPDGSEAEKSGNGVRIFARYLMDAGYEDGGQFELGTLGGVVLVNVLNADGSMIQVDMGTTTFCSEEIPVAGPSREVVDEPLEIDGNTWRMTCVSIGNPHCVIPVDRLSKDMVMALGPLLENHEMFPNRINVQLLKVVDRNTIEIEIWERGAGYTLASGSSSCAAASVARRLGLVESDVTVRMQGGEILVSFAEDGHVLMTGAVTPVMRGEFLQDLA
ncbi:MAG: diaminopimelate epimerase [Firmicutes bacterium]|nr:diaminopimelate epimerase [Bacillota bacterium]